MSTPLRRDDMDAARAKMAAHQAKCQELLGTGQKLLARIRPSSKYYGQGNEGSLFPVVVADSTDYGIIGGPGGKYRHCDVDLFVVFMDDADPIQITFEIPGRAGCAAGLTKAKSAGDGVLRSPIGVVGPKEATT